MRLRNKAFYDGAVALPAGVTHLRAGGKHLPDGDVRSRWQSELKLPSNNAIAAARQVALQIPRNARAGWHPPPAPFADSSRLVRCAHRAKGQSRNPQGVLQRRA